MNGDEKKDMKRRVVVTGVGIVSPLGHSAPSTWDNLLAGESGIKEITSFDASHFTTHVAAEVKDFDPALYLSDKKVLRTTVRFIHFALAAAEEALADAHFRPTKKNKQRWGLVVGTGMMTAEFDYWQRFHEQFASEGHVDHDRIAAKGEEFFTVTDFSKTRVNSGLSVLLQQHGIEGFSTSVHTACASSGQALGLALRAIRRGDADYMLAGGFDSMINPIGVASFCLLGALSSHNTPEARASRPFCLTRDGFVLGEGAAFLVLETLEHAQSRGAKIYAELAGEGNSLSSYRITDSPLDGDGPRQALQAALIDANTSIDEVDYINAHGTGTKMNDLSETNAIKAVLGDHANTIPISSTKGQVGHLIAAAGALEGAFCALAVHHGQVPMTANYHQPDPDCDLDYVIEGAREQRVRVALSNSFGFGGTNSSVVFREV